MTGWPAPAPERPERTPAVDGRAGDGAHRSRHGQVRAFEYMRASLATTTVAVALVFAGFLACSSSCSDHSKSTKPPADNDTTGVDTTVTVGFTIVNVYPHDIGAFTQGLVFYGDTLYEGTGIVGGSSIRKVDLETGAVLQIRPVPSPHFGEGITIWQDKLYELTWRSHVGFIYDRASFDSLGLFYYSHEGWGITHDGSRFIVSDGTATLRFWDPATLEQVGSVDVYQVLPDKTLPVRYLNELEYINGKVYANVWLSRLIAVISPQTGKVEAWIDLTDLVVMEKEKYPLSDVLNGIAYDEVNDRLFVTGKYWPEVVEIEAQF